MITTYMEQRRMQKIRMDKMEASFYFLIALAFGAGIVIGRLML